jgi:hypothetical protein
MVGVARWLVVVAEYFSVVKPGSVASWTSYFTALPTRLHCSTGEPDWDTPDGDRLLGAARAARACGG